MIFHVNIIDLVFAILVMWVILLVAEAMKRFGLVHGEYARKLIHISVGLFLATLPLYMNRREIVLINISLFIGLILLSGILHLFKSIEDVPRWTLGHFLYPIGIIAVTVIFKDPVVYSFAVLVLALSDGLAAVFGKWRGKRRYRALGGYKTFYGSTVFFIVTLVLMSTFVLVGDVTQFRLAAVIAGSLFLTGVEGAFAGGFDNLFVPVVAAALLNSL